MQQSVTSDKTEWKSDRTGEMQIVWDVQAVEHQITTIPRDNFKNKNVVTAHQ